MTPPQTLADLVDHVRANFADIEGIVDGDVRMSYAALADEIDAFAAGLIADGLQPGEAVALWAPNIWEWVVAAIGTFRAGGVLVPVNTRFKGREAAYVLGKAKVRVLVTVTGFLDADYLGMLDASGEDLPLLRRRVVLRGSTPAGAMSRTDLVGLADDAARAEVARRVAAIRPDDMGLVMFTSGTTGLPKGVMVLHNPIIRGFGYYGSCMGIQRGERYLIISPFFHAFGLNGGIVPAMMFGATILPWAVFDATKVLEVIEAERVNIAPGPPAIFQGLLNHPDLDRYDVSSLQRCVTGAATIPVEMVVQMRERLGMSAVITAYGMTETHGLASICRPEDDAETIAKTSGRALDGVELRIVDEDGAEVPRGTPGELWVRGFNVMAGYLDDPEQTAATITPDGWLRTGDIAVMDDRGYIDITDRMKDMFIVGGFNAYPAEIERMMIEHPQIGQVAVIGIPDERLGEVGAAFVVPAPGPAPEPDALIAWCREQMANYKVPRAVWLVDALPLNPSNKVLKTELRDRAAALLAGG